MWPAHQECLHFVGILLMSASFNAPQPVHPNCCTVTDSCMHCWCAHPVLETRTQKCCAWMAVTAYQNARPSLTGIIHTGMWKKMSYDLKASFYSFNWTGNLSSESNIFINSQKNHQFFFFLIEAMCNVFIFMMVLIFWDQFVSNLAIISGKHSFLVCTKALTEILIVKRILYIFIFSTQSAWKFYNLMGNF